MRPVPPKPMPMPDFSPETLARMEEEGPSTTRSHVDRFADQSFNEGESCPFRSNTDDLNCLRVATHQAHCHLFGAARIARISVADSSILSANERSSTFNRRRSRVARSRWHIPGAQVRTLCRRGRRPGARRTSRPCSVNSSHRRSCGEHPPPLDATILSHLVRSAEWFPARRGPDRPSSSGGRE